MRNKQAWAVAGLVAGFCFSSTSFSPAQSRVWNQRPGWTNSFFHDAALANLPGAVQVLTNILTSPVPTQVVTTQSSARMPAGLYWSLQGLTNHSAGPLPGSPFGTNVPVYALSSNQFVFDDRGVNYAAMTAAQGAEATNDFPGQNNAPGFDSLSALWLSIPPDGLNETNLTVMVHNAASGLAYTLLTKPDLTASSWNEEQLFYGTSSDVTQVEVARNARTNLFVWARSGAPSGLTILQQPLDQDVLEADTVTFSVLAAGNGTLSYQWMLNGTNISGATANNYAINNVQLGDAAGYSVRVSDGTNFISSRMAQLTVELGTGVPWLTVILGQRQEYTFQDGVTYYIGSLVQLFGTTTLKGGSVIKFDYMHTNATLQVMGPLVCDTQPYYPAVLTSVDDHTMGESIWWAYSGFPQPATNGAVYLDLSAAESASLKNLRVFYADRGVTTPAATRRLEVWDSQFIDCQTAIEDQIEGGEDSLHNVLIAGCTTALRASDNHYSFAAEHLTADVIHFWSAAIPPDRVGLTNSVVKGALAGGSFLANQNSSLNPTGAVFQTVNVGNYYLADNSSLHHAGTTNISPALLTELRNKSTHPPISFPGFQQISGDLTLSPQVPRYIGGPPDLGYHYDVLDYTVANLFVSEATVNVLPGTAIGYREEYWGRSIGWTFGGFDLLQGSGLLARGTPNNRIVFTDVQFIQEGFIYGCVASIVPDYWPNQNHTPPPTLDLRFLDSYVSANLYHVYSGLWENDAFDIWGDTFYASNDSLLNWRMADCHLHGGKINLGHPNYFWYRPDYVYGTGAVTWQNNVFENVSINLDPTLYEYGVNTNGLNCDLSVAVNNNLFQGGYFFRLEPIPATAGNWSLTDNLFHKVEFTLDTNLPLDFHHNAYWPKQTNELLWPWLNVEATRLLPTMTGGTTNGLNEVTLTAAPPYQAGPLGNYYLPMVTPLYHAGSRLAGEAGLSQYTTRPDQITEGEDYALFHGNANIGLHYVATSNSASLKFKDSDGDGIPDYLEDSNGNGVVDGNETDPHNTMSDGLTNDLYNAAYDDVDLSGNGMVGRIKKALGIHPLDPNNPLTLTQVITGEEPDIATFEVPVSYDAVTNVGGLGLWVDGKSVQFQECDRSTNGNCLLAWNTTYDPPGQHHAQVHLGLKGQLLKGSTPDQTVLTSVGQIASYYSSNVCQFDAFYAEYDTNNGAILYAKLTELNASYSIELKTPAGAHIKTLTGTTTSGEIKENWDLTDDSGNANTDESVNAEFSVALTDSGHSGKNAQKAYKLDRYLIFDGDFTVSYAWKDTSQAQGAMRDCIQWGVVDELIKPGWIGGLNPNPYPSTFNDYSWSGGRGVPGYIASPTDVPALLTNLAYFGTRNFHFDGHGNGGSIGNGKEENDPGLISIGPGQVQEILDNNFSKTGYHRKHPYRFVFLNACKTADEQAWSHAFGIIDRISSAQLAENPLKAQAFVGWIHKERGPSSDQEFYDFAQTYAVFYGAWMNGASLDQCIDMASKEYPFPGDHSIHLNFPLAKKYESWEVAFRQDQLALVNDFRIKIYGYAGIKRTGYEPGHDGSQYYK